MVDQDTICYKITKCFEILEEATKTKELDLQGLSRNLHEIRTDAQNMENGLRWRAEVMYDAGIEEAYQKERKKKLAPPGINKIVQRKEEYVIGAPEYNITITKDKEVIYDNMVHAGSLSVVERFDDIDKYGTVTGQSQQLFFGHPLIIFYSFDQLGKALESKKLEIMTAFQEVMSKKKDVDPSVKKMLRELTNKK